MCLGCLANWKAGEATLASAIQGFRESKPVAVTVAITLKGASGVLGRMSALPGAHHLP